MAKMIPSQGPRDHTALSKEGKLYDALSRLPDDYYVVHSLSLLLTGGGNTAQREIDFVIFHPKLGILCVEAKAGSVRCEDGVWYYHSGKEMNYESPYTQVSTAMHKLMALFKERNLGEVVNNCKFVSAVWLVDIRRTDYGKITPPTDGNMDVTLFFDDLVDPEPTVRRILTNSYANKKTQLSHKQELDVVRRILCPEFSIVPTTRLEYDLADVTFARLLDSQTRVLDFIRDQRFAVINGAAGTGKTLVAMERARRAALEGRVLFLCYNTLLGEDLADRLSDEKMIEVRTIASYACKVCKTSKPDYTRLGERLMAYLDDGGFPYDHVIVDEGQDFGVAAIEEASILDILLELVRSRGGTFYLFYDRRQFVQGSSMPTFINNADCKLTLYVNCRNTEDIARCSLNALGDKEEAEVLEGARTSSAPRLFASKDRLAQVAFIDEEIRGFTEHGLKTVILTCKTENTSVFRDYVSHGTWRGGGVRFTTCRKFKGLEADAVVLVDVDEGAWRGQVHDYDPAPGLIFYTGSSRAKHELRIVCDMDEQQCQVALGLMGVEAKRKPISRFAKELAAKNMSK